MTHTPDHKEDIRSAIREWLRDDVRIAGTITLLSYEDQLIEKIAKVVEKAKKQDQKTS